MPSKASRSVKRVDKARKATAPRQSPVNTTARKEISQAAYEHLGPDGHHVQRTDDDVRIMLYSAHGWAGDHGLEVKFERVEIPEGKVDQFGRRCSAHNYFVSGEPAHVQKVLEAAAVVDKWHEAETTANGKYKDLAAREEERARTARDKELHKVAQGLVPGAEPWPSQLDRTMDEQTARSATCIAAQFGIMQKGLPTNAVADDAIRLAKLGTNVRRAIEQKESPDKYVQLAQIIARRYDAEVLDNRDLHGWVMCLKFPEGAYIGGVSNRFFVA